MGNVSSWEKPSVERREGDKAETENHDQGWLLVERKEGAAARLAQTHSQGTYPNNNAFW